MTLKSYLVAPYASGLERDVEPWLIPEDAFETLENAYVWRGRVRKRLGTALLGADQRESRLRLSLGDTDGNGDISVTVPGTIFKVGQIFTIGSEIFTVNVLGAPATLLDTGSATLATFNTTTGALVITGADATTTCFFYPAEPVMGLRLRENTDLNFEPTVAFDTQFAYQRTGGAWGILDNGVPPVVNQIWTGGDSDFFWTTNYRGPNPFEQAFYVVNGVRADRIQFLIQGSSTWVTLRPQLDSGAVRFLDSCKVLLPFKDRLVALNTLEVTTGPTNVQFENRARWSQNGDPAAAATAWLDDTPGRGGFIDAPVSQAIVTAEFVKDRLIVYFERSTWELVYTADVTLPFRWSQINSELGAESTFSIISFDEAALGVGNVGVHSCNGVNVRRIDEKIPDQVFQVHNGNDGPMRVYGIRDFYRELVYWTFPSSGSNPTYPNRVLLYNYRNTTWAEFIDSFTCFGYLQRDSDVTWGNVGELYPTWAEWNDPWNSAQAQSQFPFIISGNQEGWTHILDADRSSNSQSLQITDMTPGTSTLTVIAHNLSPLDYVIISDAQGITSLNDIVVQVSMVTDDDNIVIDTTFTGTYTGGGQLTRISPINIFTKQFNPGTPVGQQFRFPYIDFLLEATAEGEVSVNYFLDTETGDSAEDQAAADVLLGDVALFTRPESSLGDQTGQVRIWHRFYLQSLGTFIQLRVFLSDSQIRDLSISHSDFELDAMLIYVEPSGRIIG